MADRLEWVEIIEPRTQERMYANLATGECAWNPPPGVKIKKSTDAENQWWELFDSKTQRFYYYNAGSQKTVWHRPRDGDIIPLAKLQTLKNNTEVAIDDDADTTPVVQREISTQTPTPKKESAAAASSSSRGVVSAVGGGRPATAVARSSAAAQTSASQTSPQQVRKHRQTHQARRTQSTLDKVGPSATPRGDIVEPIELSRTQTSIARRTTSHAAASSAPASSRRDPMSPATAAPQRSLESPQSRQSAAPQQHFFRDVAAERSMAAVSAATMGAKPNHIHATSAASYFQRQDSCPVTRDGGRSMPYDAMVGGSHAAQYQDVSQITAVQVTPRPKPRAFPRTNPSYVGMQRRDVGSTATYHPKDSTGGGAAAAFNQGYRLRQQQQQQQHGMAVDRVPTSQFYPSAVGSQTLQTARSYQSRFDAARRSGVLDDQDSDSSQSSSSSGGSANGMRRQYTLDSRPARATASAAVPRSIPAADRPSAISEMQPIRPVARRPNEPQRTIADNATATSSDRSPATETRQMLRPRQPPARAGTMPNGAVRPSTRRNSEPDYVNVPSKSSADMLHPVRENISVCEPPRTVPEPSRAAAQEPLSSPASRGSDRSPPSVDGQSQKSLDDVRNGEGTLRIRDHISPSDYVNCDEIRLNSAHAVAAGHISMEGYHDDGINEIGSFASSAIAHQNVPSSFSGETHHPSLRRRKWVEKPGSSLAPTGPIGPGGSPGAQHIVRQSTLEKSLSLQAELAQQRPVSMLVPFSGGGGGALDTGNLIVNQVADTLLQQMDIERFLSENLNEHRKGILGKTVPVGSMLIWTKDIIQKPMIKTESKLTKKEAPEVFKLIQTYMGDRKPARDTATPCGVALDVIHKGWSVAELRDEIFIQICRQTTRNPREESLLKGWELMAMCLSFFPPSAKFQSYLEGHIYRCLDTRDPTHGGQLHHFASTCVKRLERVIEKRDLRRPSLDEIEHSKWSLVQPSMFGGTLEEVMDLQQERFPGNRLPWIQTVLSEQLLRLCGSQLTEGIFRVPGDTDEVSALKVQCDRWTVPDDGSDPHIVASLLKLWYRELYEPLIPRDFYARCVEAYEDAVAAVGVVKFLPELNRLVLTYLIRFLQKFAAPENAAITKMDANNLAMVMAPNCLRCDSSDPQVMFDNARKEMGFIRTLVQHLDTSDIDGIV